MTEDEKVELAMLGGDVARERYQDHRDSRICPQCAATRDLLSKFTQVFMAAHCPVGRDLLLAGWVPRPGSDSGWCRR